MGLKIVFRTDVSANFKVTWHKN